MIKISAGVEFDTPFEEGCVAMGTPDERGNFPARDSDGVECGFNVRMVKSMVVDGVTYTEADGVFYNGHPVWYQAA